MNDSWLYIDMGACVRAPCTVGMQSCRLTMVWCAQDAMAQSWFTTEDGLPDVAAIAATAAEVGTSTLAHMCPHLTLCFVAAGKSFLRFLVLPCYERHALWLNKRQCLAGHNIHSLVL